MINYTDLGFDNNLQATDRLLANSPFVSGIHSDAFLEGVDGGQILSQGSFSSARGNWQIGFDNEKIVPQQDASYNRSLKYGIRVYKAIVATDGSGDYDNIQEAVEYVNRQGGGAIFIAAGTYTLTSDITLYSHIHLVGDGTGRTIINFNEDYKIALIGDGTALSKLMAYADDAYQDISIENLQIYNSADEDGAVQIIYVRNLRITNVIFKNVTQAVRIWALPGIIETSSVYDNAYQGSGFIIGGSVLAINNHIEGDDSGVGISLGANCRVISNYVSNFYVNIRTDNNTTSAIISNNVVKATAGGGGIKLSEGSNYNSINNNYVAGEASDYADIEVIGNYNSIIGNTIISTSDTAIHVANANNTRIIGNAASNNNAALSEGLLIDNTADRTLYDGNDFEDFATAITDNGTNSKAGDNIIA